MGATLTSLPMAEGVSVLRFGIVGSFLLATLACAPREAAPPGGVVDDLGHAVVLARPAARIVSLSPSTTELLFAIGAGAQVVGRTRWCDYPPEVATVPSVGDGLNPNVELVVARRPDLVVFYASPANDGAIARLAELGITTASLRLDRLDEGPRAARLLGRLTGQSARADSLADAFATGLDSARAARPPATVRVAVLVWDNPPIVIGAGSFLTELLSLAGARNVFDDVPKPSAPTSVEAITARDPDLLLVLGKEAPPELVGRPEWRGVRAVRLHRILAVAGSEFERPSFRSLEAVRRLGAAIARAAP